MKPFSNIQEAAEFALAAVADRDEVAHDGRRYLKYSEAMEYLNASKTDEANIALIQIREAARKHSLPKESLGIKTESSYSPRFSCNPVLPLPTPVQSNGLTNRMTNGKPA